MTAPDDTGHTAEDVVEFDISRALDEIYALRRALAYEAMVTAAHLNYKTFPKSRRGVAEQQIERMCLGAQGRVQKAYAGNSYQVMARAMEEAGASETLTRWQWEHEL